MPRHPKKKTLSKREVIHRINELYAEASVEAFMEIRSLNIDYSHYRITEAELQASIKAQVKRVKNLEKLASEYGHIAKQYPTKENKVKAQRADDTFHKAMRHWGVSQEELVNA